LAVRTCPGLGSVIALSNENKEIIERYSYHVFGEPNGTSDVNNPYMFTGRRYDPEAGLYYYRARYYDYYTGRFLQTDPIGYAGGMNLYAYCWNNSVSFVDPLGLTYESNWNYLLDFLTGGGETDRYYGPETIETQEMMVSLGADKVREQFVEGGYEELTDGYYGTLEAAGHTILNPFTRDLGSTATQVGGFGSVTVIPSKNGTAAYTITNYSGTKSFFYHIVPNRQGTTGPMRTITQTFQWTEIYDWDKYMGYVNDLIGSAKADMQDPRVQRLLDWYKQQKKGDGR
jgi:RHS repeat-associated protein